MTKKPRGEIGGTKITATTAGQVAELISSNLPAQKEELEAKFAQLFVSAFNAQKPLGEGP